MSSKIEAIANSRFMNRLEEWSQRLSQSPAFGTIGQGLGYSMGLIMIGAVVQVICAIGSLVFGWSAGQPLYDALYMPYELTMGILGLFLSFNIAYVYARRLKIKADIQCGFVSMVCFILVCSPLQTFTTEAGNTVKAIGVSGLGSNGVFCAILIGLISVRITKFANDHHLVIRMPDVVPEGILNSFNSIIPAGINILVWYGLILLISTLSNGTLTLATLITTIIATPLSYLVSPFGMVIIILVFCLSWFFGIHGGSVVFTAIMPIFIAAYMTNAELAAAGQPLQFNPIFLYGALSVMGGSGNTLPLVVMGLHSKSERIRAVSQASLVPGLFNINEPAIFGFPIIYNPILFIPFALNSVVCMFFLWLAFSMGWIALPQILIMTTLPIIVQQIMSSLSWKNGLFCVLMFPIIFAIYYPFYKVYEKQCVAKEIEEAKEQREEQEVFAASLREEGISERETPVAA